MGRLCPESELSHILVLLYLSAFPRSDMVSTLKDFVFRIGSAFIISSKPFGGIYSQLPRKDKL